MSLNDVVAQCMDCETEITNSDRFDMMRNFADLSTCPSCGGTLIYKEDE